MVQDQAADTDLGIGIAQGLKKIPALPIDSRRQAGRPRHQVETSQTRSRQRGMNALAQPSPTRSDFHDSSRTGDSAFQFAHNPSRIAEIAINPPQIPATPDSAGVVRGQRVQNLGNNDTRQWAHIFANPHRPFSFPSGRAFRRRHGGFPRLSQSGSGCSGARARGKNSIRARRRRRCF